MGAAAAARPDRVAGDELDAGIFQRLLDTLHPHSGNARPTSSECALAPDNASISDRLLEPCVGIVGLRSLDLDMHPRDIVDHVRALGTTLMLLPAMRLVAKFTQQIAAVQRPTLAVRPRVHRVSFWCRPGVTLVSSFSISFGFLRLVSVILCHQTSGKTLGIPWLSLP
jgi:hypothetical protein